MLNEEMILFALNDMDDTLLERTRLALGLKLGAKKHGTGKYIRIVLLAAVISAPFLALDFRPAWTAMLQIITTIARI